MSATPLSLSAYPHTDNVTTLSTLTDYLRGRVQLRPKYQRKACWTIKQKLLFIRTIMDKYPIPPILLCTYCNDDDTEHDGEFEIEFECIDGQNRLLTLRQFMRNEPVVLSVSRTGVEQKSYVYWISPSDKKRVFYNDPPEKWLRNQDKIGWDNCRGMTRLEKHAFHAYSIQFQTIHELLSYEQRVEIFTRLQNGSTSKACERQKNLVTPLTKAITNQNLRDAHLEMISDLNRIDESYIWIWYLMLINTQETLPSDAYWSKIQFNKQLNGKDEFGLTDEMLEYGIPIVEEVIDALYSTQSPDGNSLQFVSLLSLIHIWAMHEIRPNSLWNAIELMEDSNVAVLAWTKKQDHEIVQDALNEREQYLLDLIETEKNAMVTVVESVVESNVESVVESDVESVVEPVVESDVEPVVESGVESVVESVVEPVVEPVVVSKYRKEKIGPGTRKRVWLYYVGETSSNIECFCCRETVINYMKSYVCGHVVSESQGGETTLENLAPVCAFCNGNMGTKHMAEYMKTQKHDTVEHNSKNRHPLLPYNYVLPSAPKAKVTITAKSTIVEPPVPKAKVTITAKSTIVEPPVPKAKVTITAKSTTVEPPVPKAKVTITAKSTTVEPPVPKAKVTITAKSTVVEPTVPKAKVTITAKSTVVEPPVPKAKVTITAKSTAVEPPVPKAKVTITAKSAIPTPKITSGTIQPTLPFKPRKP